MPQFGKEEIDNLTKVIESGWFCDKPDGFMEQFRNDFAQAMHSKHAISGATAMLLMQAIPGAIGAVPGDEIIVDPVVQFHAIACLHNFLVPVWADVRPDDFLLDPTSVEAHITPKTKAIWVTHLWGYPADVEALRAIADRHNIYLLEDCAHSIFAEYKGKKLGTWGQIGTFSFNMFKQLALGEGGMAITDDDRLYAELNKRIIFGESPEVLSSNYRMTEFQAAVGVVQLKKVPGYLETYREGARILEEAIAGCKWLDSRPVLPGGVAAPYFWCCLFHGERAGIDHGVFKAALRQANVRFSTGFLQVPGYLYNLFRKARVYADYGHEPLTAGLCPVAEDTMPRLTYTNNMVSVETCRAAAAGLQEAIRLAESGNVLPLTYSEVEKQVMEVVKECEQAEPNDVIRIFDAKGWEHFDEHGMWTVMENLRDRYPYKLSHAGPRSFAYHDLS